MEKFKVVILLARLYFYFIDFEALTILFEKFILFF